MALLICLIVPIGPIISLLKSWFASSRNKLKNATKVDLPYPIEEPKLFGLKDTEKLPLPENEAIAEARNRIGEGQFAEAKAILTQSWLLNSDPKTGEIPRLKLREAFAEFYRIQGDETRAQLISEMALIILDVEIKWANDHPDYLIGDGIATSHDSPRDGY